MHDKSGYQILKGVSNGGFSRSGLVLPFFFSLFVPLIWDFPDFLGFSRITRGWSGIFRIWTCPSLFLVLFCPFSDFPDFSGIFLICAGMVRGFSRFVLFLFLSLLRAPTRNSLERVRDTIWTFPEKSGKHPGLETPRFSFSQYPAPKLAECCRLVSSPRKIQEQAPELPQIDGSLCSRRARKIGLINLGGGGRTQGLDV